MPWLCHFSARWRTSDDAMRERATRLPPLPGSPAPSMGRHVGGLEPPARPSFRLAALNCTSAVGIPPSRSRFEVGHADRALAALATTPPASSSGTRSRVLRLICCGPATGGLETEPRPLRGGPLRPKCLTCGIPGQAACRTRSKRPFHSGGSSPLAVLAHPSPALLAFALPAVPSRLPSARLWPPQRS